MAQLQTHRTDTLRTVGDEQGGRGFPNPEPGEYVYHSDDRDSFGIIVSQVGTESAVIWSKQPKVIDVQVQSQPIVAQSRKLKARWSAAEEPDVYSSPNYMFRSERTFDVEEEYIGMSYEEVQRLYEEGAKVTLHIDGRVTVKRQTTQPPDARYKDERIIKRRIDLR